MELTTFESKALALLTDLHDKVDILGMNPGKECSVNLHLGDTYLTAGHILDLAPARDRLNTALTALGIPDTTVRAMLIDPATNTEVDI
jgi:hypothetical protein